MATFKVQFERCDWDIRLSGFAVIRNDGKRWAKFYDEKTAQSRCDFLNEASKSGIRCSIADAMRANWTVGNLAA